MAIDSSFKTPDQLVLADVEKLPIDAVCRELLEHVDPALLSFATDAANPEEAGRWAVGDGVPSIEIDVRLRHALAAVRVLHGHDLGDDDVHRWFFASSAFLREGSAVMALKSAQPGNEKVLDEILAGAATYLQLP